MIEIKENAVFRDGERVGTVEGESLIVPEKLHHTVVKKLEKETGLTVVVAGEATEPDEPPADPPATPPPAAPVEEPEPPKDHRGDKTPAFIEWLFRNRPEEAATRYANRRISRQ